MEDCLEACLVEAHRSSAAASTELHFFRTCLACLEEDRLVEEDHLEACLVEAHRNPVEAHRNSVEEDALEPQSA